MVAPHLHWTTPRSETGRVSVDGNPPVILLGGREKRIVVCAPIHACWHHHGGG